MDEALKMGQTTVIGSLQLFIARVISTIILAVGTIVLGLFILESDYGLYAIALVPATTILLFQDWGIGSAMTRYCAKFRSENETQSIRKLIVAGFAFELATGIALTLFSLLTANFMASAVFNKPEASLVIALASITIFSSAIGVVPSGVFVGFENMKIGSWLLFFSALIQGLAAPLLVYFGYGALGAIFAYTIGGIVTSIASVFLLYFLVYRKLPQTKIRRSEITLTLRSLLSYGVPLSVGNMVSGLAVQFTSFMMVYYSSTSMLGNNRVATNFGVLLTFVTIPVATVLFPAFSKLNPEKDKNLLKTVFSASVKYTSFFLVPATMAMMTLSVQIVGAIYGNKWNFSPPFLVLGVASNLFVLFGSQSIPILLSALGETKLLMKTYLLYLCITIPVGFLLIPSFGIVGALLSTLIASLPRTLTGLYFVWKHHRVNVNFFASAKIFLASSISTVAVYSILSILNVDYWIKLIAGLILFLLVYLLSAPIIGAVNKTDLDTLRTMFSNLGVVSKILNIPLKIMETALRMRPLKDEKRGIEKL
jgi:stage V sporulation protein B